MSNLWFWVLIIGLMVLCALYFYFIDPDAPIIDIGWV